jgi:hypothetical protein
VPNELCCHQLLLAAFLQRDDVADVRVGQAFVTLHDAIHPASALRFSTPLVHDQIRSQRWSISGTVHVHIEATRAQGVAIQSCSHCKSDVN